MGFLDRLKSGLARTAQQLADKFDDIVRLADTPEARQRELDGDTVDALEEILIKADVGVAASQEIVAAVARTARRTESLRELLKQEIVRVLEAPNFAAGAGCRIYADRPPSCRSFSCRWLTDPMMGPEWKPSVCKMVLDAKPRMLAVHVDPAVSRPWRAEPYYSVLKRLSAQGLERSIIVLVIERRRNIVILPTGGDMGILGRPDRAERDDAQGLSWQPRVMGAGSR